MKYKKIKLPLFPIEYSVFIGDTIKDAEDKAQEIFPGIKNTAQEIGKNVIAITEEIKNNKDQKFFIVKLQKDATLEVITHEALHLTNFLMSALSLSNDAEGGETQCYIQGNIIHNILLCIDQQKASEFVGEEIKTQDMLKHKELYEEINKSFNADEFNKSVTDLGMMILLDKMPETFTEEEFTLRYTKGWLTKKLNEESNQSAIRIIQELKRRELILKEKSKEYYSKATKK